MRNMIFFASLPALSVLLDNSALIDKPLRKESKNNKKKKEGKIRQDTR